MYYSEVVHQNRCREN